MIKLLITIYFGIGIFHALLIFVYKIIYANYLQEKMKDFIKKEAELNGTSIEYEEELFNEFLYSTNIIETIKEIIRYISIWPIDTVEYIRNWKNIK